MGLSIKKLSCLLIPAAVIILPACSSDDGGGSTGNATLSVDNAQSLAIAGTEGVKQAVNNDSVSPFAKTDTDSPLESHTIGLARQLTQETQLAEIPDFCESGSVDQSYTESSGTITYNSCDIGGVIFNGTASITSSTAGSITTFSITYSSFTVSYDDVTESVDLSITCKNDSSAGTVNCIYNSSAPGIDGRIYSVSNTVVSGDNYSGYTISATVTDPDNGNITITTSSPVSLTCSNGQPVSGAITVSDGTNSMVVTYIDCNSYSIDFDGSTTTYNW